MRQAIFLSHATPEDNEFVRWLGAKLELAGYVVWHDLARLKGGDYFWDKIEAAIRNDAFRLVAVVSRVSVGKQGVKDEWAVAGTVERSVPGFIIPVRLDDIPFTEIPITLHRKNLIDFAGGWHKGLAQLIDTLEDAKTPKVGTVDPGLVRHWLPESAASAIVRTEFTETLDSSWLAIVSLPPTLETARILGNDRQIKETEENRVVPWCEVDDRIVSFARAQDLVSLMSNSVMLKASSAVDTKTFIDEGSSIGKLSVPWWEARKRVFHLVRQAWELALEARGFVRAQQANGKTIFYVPPEITGGRGKRITYEDWGGRKRRKALNGKSEKRNACWAYGLGMVPSFDEPWRIELRATVVFTDEDGNLMDVAKAHRLRRSFCRSWWNEHWRTLMRSFLWLASDGKPELQLAVGSGRSIVVSIRPIEFEAPVGLSDVEPAEDVEPTENDDDEADLNDEEAEEDQR